MKLTMSKSFYKIITGLPTCLMATLSFILVLSADAQVSVTGSVSGKNVFPLVGTANAAILYDSQDFEVVKKTAGLLAEDVHHVTGKNVEVLPSLSDRYSNIIIAGTVGRNASIDRLVREKKVDITGIKGGWEQYIIQLVANPFPGVSKALVIAGSDRRGTAYGLFSVSEAIGVSPWYWWADVPVKKRSSIYLSVAAVASKAPSVKYRGIFINDEDFGLKPWAAKTFDPALNDIGPKTYSRICELLLRLKANYLCPAMHSCSGAFNKYPENKLVADSFAIVMGSIHCEPLLFNNAAEWNSKTMGEWNYVTNKEGINKVLKKRVEENGKYENVYTLAMRGIHDAVMAGNLTLEDQARVLEKAFADQRGILSSTINKPAEDIPQVFYPYKEVLDTYEHGMNLPDDVTLVWSDDDFGYMKRLSNEKEQKRAGRAGVYYHISYWGPPKNYLWISATPPALMYGELKKAYETTADRLWVVNVGDIKPAEYPLTLFMDMAYDINRFNYENINRHHTDFLCSVYGEQFREDFTDILSSYYKLAFARRAEFMERSTDTEFSIQNYMEADRRLAEYQRIADKTSAIMNKLDREYMPSFFQLMYYPVKGSDLMNKMTLDAQKNRLFARQQRASANSLKKKVYAYCDSLQDITKEYNELLGGKWKGMMSLLYGGARSFEVPQLDSVNLALKPSLGVFAEEEDLGTGMKSFHSLPCFNRFTRRSYYIEIYNKGLGQLEWTAKSSDPWIIISRKSGITQSDERINVSVDWNKVPAGESIAGKVDIYNGKKEVQSVLVSVFNPAGPSPNELNGIYIEENGYVSIDAAGFHRKKETEDIKFSVINGLGFENKVVQLGDPFAKAPYLPSLVLTSNYVAPVRDNRFPALEYDFYSFHSGPVDVYTYMVPVFPLDNEHGARYGVMVDNSPVFLPEASAPYYTTPWIQSILRNCRINKTTHIINKPGKHTVKIYCAHPGMMLQKIVLDFGGLKRSYEGPEITKVN